MSGLSLPHILLLLGIVILVFGTSKLKNLGKDLGGAIKGFKESMKGDEEPAAPVAPPAQIQQTQTPPAQPVPPQAAPAATPTADTKPGQ